MPYPWLWIYQYRKTIVQEKVKTEQYALSPSYGDTVIEATNTDLKTLNPLNFLDATSNMVHGLIYGAVTGVDSDGRIGPGLAHTWEVSNDRKVITFNLRREVVWHDGHPFTANDVKFTFDLVKDAKTKTIYRDLAKTLDEIRVVDDHTFKAIFNTPCYFALPLFNIGLLARHVMEGMDVNNEASHRNPVGLGPFRLMEWQPNEQIVFESNETYYMRKPYLDGYIIKCIPDPSMEFLALKRGDIDVMGLTPDQFTKQVDEDFREKFKIHTSQASRSYTFVGYNLDNPHLSLLNVRKALVMAVNRNFIIEKVIHGFGNKLSGPFPYDSWPCNQEIAPYPYNTKEAAVLLDKEGYSDGNGDGILEKDGKKLSLRLFTVNGNANYCLSADIIADYWRKIGVEVKVEYRDFASVLDAVQRRDLDTLLLGYSFGLGYHLVDMWHSSKIPEGESGRRGLNLMGYINPRVDEIIEQLETEFDEALRTELYQEFHSIVSRDQPQLFLYSIENIVAYDKRFHAVNPSDEGFLHSITRWYVPEELQKYE